MKKILLIGALFLMSATAGFSQFNFRLTYGSFDSKMATFSYRFGNWAPYVGFDGLTAKFDYEYTDLVDADENESITLKASLLAPTIGLRYYFLEVDRLQAYGNASFQKAFLGGEMKQEGVTVKVKDLLEKKSVFQCQLSFGAEYFFNNNLSLIAEYGFRYANANFETAPELIESGKYEFSINPFMTFAKIGLGFHF